MAEADEQRVLQTPPAVAGVEDVGQLVQEGRVAEDGTPLDSPRRVSKRGIGSPLYLHLHPTCPALALINM